MKKLIFILAFIPLSVFAGGSHHDDDEHTNIDYQTTNITIHKHNNTGTAIVGGVILTCAIVSAINKRWCWQESKTVDLHPKKSNELYILEGR